MQSDKCTRGIRHLWQRLFRELIQEVPRDYGACEFDCRKPDCTQGEWESCRRRLRSRDYRKPGD